jgi:putative exosortase-associated protein (TIGR04073 family)
MALCLLAPLPLAAATASEPVWPRSYADGAVRKLGRSVANLATAPLELVRKPQLIRHRDGGVAAVTVGVAQGVRSMVERAGAGVIELLTFPVPFPRAEFQPLVTPEFVYSHGEWVND